MARLRRAAACACLLLAGSAGAMDEVPFIATPDNVTLEMLRLAGVQPDDYVIDLGSGDGRIVILAAARFGARGLGVEYVPELVRQSIEHAHAAGVAERAQFVVQDLHDADLSRATVITLYLLTEVNLELRPRLLALRPGTRVVSHDWDMGDWPADRIVTVDAPDKEIGLEKRSTLYLWVVPAHIDGTWCSARGTLAFAQRYQTFNGTLSTIGATSALEGRIEGARAIVGTRRDALTLVLRDGRLRVQEARGRYASLARATFARAAGGVCRH